MDALEIPKKPIEENLRNPKRRSSKIIAKFHTILLLGLCNWELVNKWNNCGKIDRPDIQINAETGVVAH